MFSARALTPIEVRFPACGVFVLESRHARGFRMAPMRHDYLKILQPFSGAGRLVRGRMRLPLRPGDVVVIPPDTLHHLEDEGAQPLSLYALCIAPTLIDHAPVPPPGKESFRHFSNPLWGAEFRSLIRHLLHEQTLGRAGSEWMIMGLAWQMLAQLVRVTNRHSAVKEDQHDQLARSRVEAYARELERTFYLRQSIDDAACTLGLCRRRFTQLFREITGDSWRRLLQHHRLAHARRLLEGTVRSTVSISYECGFDDLTTFYRAFKAVERTSPLAWRKARTRHSSSRHPRPSPTSGPSGPATPTP